MEYNIIRALMNPRFERLKLEIFQRSQEKESFERAVLEWDHVKMEDGGGSCLCEQEIKYKHHLRHRQTGEEVVVGSICVFRFMRPNIRVVAAAERAEYEFVRKPCGRCEKWTKHPQFCKKCEKEPLRLAEEQRKIEAAAAEKLRREALWKKVESMIYVPALNQVEREFVCESVRTSVLAGRILSPKQRSWLRLIMTTRPRTARAEERRKLPPSTLCHVWL